MKYNMESDSLNKIVDCVFENLKNNKIDLAEAIAFIAVRSYETGYNDAVEELKRNVGELL